MNKQRKRKIRFRLCKRFFAAIHKHRTGVHYLAGGVRVQLRYARVIAAMTMKISSVMIVQKEIVVEIYSS